MHARTMGAGRAPRRREEIGAAGERKISDYSNGAREYKDHNKRVASALGAMGDHACPICMGSVEQRCREVRGGGVCHNGAKQAQTRSAGAQLTRAMSKAASSAWGCNSKFGTTRNG